MPWLDPGQCIGDCCCRGGKEGEKKEKANAMVGTGIGLLGAICLFFQYCGMMASVFVREAFSFGSMARWIWICMCNLYMYCTGYVAWSSRA